MYMLSPNSVPDDILDTLHLKYGALGLFLPQLHAEAAQRHSRETQAHGCGAA